MLDGLVGGAVLSQADGVVSHHENGACLAQRRHADGRPHVVCACMHGDQSQAIQILAKRSFTATLNCSMRTRTHRHMAATGH